MQKIKKLICKCFGHKEKRIAYIAYGDAYLRIYCSRCGKNLAPLYKELENETDGL
ncbi:DUF1660 family phage protein [Prevotella sp. KH2C16]|uniref:DUF1660 family phage protein n=1 Tax=Prevotella sp. KH2C16 TaxID=1855325 RepID=UPI000B8377B0